MPMYNYQATPLDNAHRIKGGQIAAANKKEAVEKVKALFGYLVTVVVNDGAHVFVDDYYYDGFDTDRH